jgi:hypothetical protein
MKGAIAERRSDHVTANRSRRSSWMLQESEVKGREHQHDSYVHSQPFPESVLEEQEIDGDDRCYHQEYIQCGGRLACHVSPV